MRIPHRNAAVWTEPFPKENEGFPATGPKVWEGGGQVMRAKSEYISVSHVRTGADCPGEILRTQEVQVLALAGTRQCLFALPKRL